MSKPSSVDTCPDYKQSFFQILNEWSNFSFGPYNAQPFTSLLDYVIQLVKF